MVGRALYNWYSLLVHDRELHATDEIHAMALDHATLHDLDTYVTGLRRVRAGELVLRGRWDEALELSVDPTTGEPDDHFETTTVRAIVESRRGGNGGADSIDEALAQAERTGQTQFIVPVLLARAELAWMQDDLELAAKNIQLARDRDAEQVHLRRDIELWASRVGAGAGAAGLDGPAGDEVAGRIARAAPGWSERGCVFDTAMALAGSDEPAELREAIERLDSIGATAVSGKLRAQMRRSGHRAIPPAPRATTRAHPMGLTTREREVLDLVAEGLRNKDIAARLYVSPKTVAVHVSSIMRKLDVSTRGEAAAWVHAHGDSI